MYHVSTQGNDERMINVHYYYYQCAQTFAEKITKSKTKTLDSIFFLSNFSLTLRQPMVKPVKTAGTCTIVMARYSLILQMTE